MSWRVVKSTGGAFWLERNQNAGPSGGPGDEIFFANEADARGALAALAAELGAVVLEARPPKKKGARRG